MARSFNMSAKEEESAERWIKTHNCAAIQHRKFTYKFTPTGIGSVVVVACSCGREKDVTDLDGW